MKAQVKKILIQYKTGLFILFLIVVPVCRSAAQCPPNIDFEGGDFTGWQCYAGDVQNNTGIITLNPSSPLANRHVMLASLPGNGNDFWGGFPKNCPNGSGHSIRLGNSTGGRGAERVSYTFTIPPTQNTFSLIYNYAIVLEDFGHTAVQQPRLSIEVLNLTDNVVDPCSSFDFIVGANLPGFYDSPESTPGVPVRCKDWSAASINLDGKAGKTIQISFTTSDCSQGNHFGYAYIDINTQCGTSFVGSTFCPGDTAISITAPFGYQSYRWFDIANTNLGTGQVLTYNPPPPAGTIVFVELTPYNGYGCVQVLTATLENTLTVSANAGPDRCDILPVQIGMPTQPGLVYKWTPSAGLNNPNISNPIATPAVNTQYVLTVSSIGGGCVATDSVNVYAETISDSIQIIGPAAYCTGSGQSTSLRVFPAFSIQWFKDNIAITGANQTQLNITQSGSYYAVLSNSAGCGRTTATKQITISQSPVAGFTVNNAQQCFTTNQFNYINTSIILSGTAQYLWDLGDGTTATTANVSHRYTQPGNYLVKLLTTSDNGCADSSSVNVTVYPFANADFEVKPVCIDINLPLINKTINNTGSNLNYLWDFGNGQTSTLINPVYRYSVPGTYVISLSVNTSQCPLTPTTKKINLVVDAPATGITYPEKNAVINFPELLQARQIGQAVWTPAVNLDNRYSYNPTFVGRNPQLYTIELKTLSGCVTIDTQMVKTHKKIAIYVPTVFTPGNDGINDYLRPLLMGFDHVNYFRIYNRWGKLIFQMKNDRPGWDGRIGGQPSTDTQTVVWIIEAVDVDGVLHKKQGTTILMR